MRLLLACLAVVSCAAIAGAARADELSELEKAYGAYAAHKYEDAEARLRLLLDPKTAVLKEPDMLADARMYLGAVLVAEGKKEEAAAVLEALLLDRPDYQPDPLRVSLPALDAVIDARVRLRDKLGAIQAEKVRKALEEKAKIEAERQKAALRLAMLEKLAMEQIVVERHSRWEALVPFGVGQFQNRQPVLGWTFLIGESLLAAGSTIGIGYTLYNQNLAYDAFANRETTATGYESRAQQAAFVADAFAIGFGAAAIAGVVQAQLGFVPEHVHVEVRRSLPVSIAPTFGPGTFGIVGKF